MSKSRITILCVAAIIVATGVLHLATIRDGHNWGGDFSFYIHHAKNIAEGKPYADTGFVYNPHSPHLSPESFPPVFPLMLAPQPRRSMSLALCWIARPAIGSLCALSVNWQRRWARWRRTWAARVRRACAA